MHNHNNNNNINRNVTEHKAFLAEAHTDFQHSVTNGISKLRESGFSKQRAIEILLKFIRQQDDVPKDDEIFQVMQTLRLGFNHAMQCLIVAKAVSRIQQGYGLEKAQALKTLSKDVTKYTQDFSVSIVQHGTTTDSSNSIITEDVSSLKVNLSSSHATTARKGPSTPISSVHSTNTITTVSTKSNSTNHAIRNASTLKNPKKLLATRTKTIRKRKEEQEEKNLEVVSTKEDKEQIRKSSPMISVRNKRVREDGNDHHILPTGNIGNTSSSNNGVGGGHNTNGGTNGVPESIVVDGNLMVSSKRQRLDSI
jgi:hypothetical protein